MRFSARPPRTYPSAAALIGLLILTAGTAAAADAPAAAGGHAGKSAAQFMPAATVAYLEVSRPKEAVAVLADHPLVKLIRQSPDFRKRTESEQFQQFLTVVGLVEARADVKWRPALEAITGGGVALGIDPASQGAILLIRSNDVKTADSVREALFSLARDDAKSHGRPDPVELKDYRGLSAWKTGDSWMAKLDEWTLFSNKAEAARAAADLFLDGGKSLADEAEFSAARDLATRGGDHAGAGQPAAWGFVRLNTLRQMGVAKELLEGNDAKSDNVGAELLAGGVLSVLRKSPLVVATLDLSEPGVPGGQSARLSLASPSDPSWVPAAQRFYFAPGGGGADQPLRPKNMVLSLSTWRDLSALFQAAPDLFNEGVAGQIAQADSGLSTFLGGKSFSADVLGALEPQMQFVAAAQDYKAAGVPEPGIRLPGMAAVFKIKQGQSKTIRKTFRLAFQSLVTFGNLDAASKSRPTLDSRTETRGKSEILYATYEAPDAADEKPAKGGDGKGAAAEGAGDKAGGEKMAGKSKDDTYYNFSPAIVISSDHLMICTTRAIAEELADLAEAQADGADRHGNGKGPANTRVIADAAPVAALLRENREQLIAQNMLQKGHDRAAAEKDVNLLISMVECLKDATLKLDQTDKSVRVEMELKTK